jgi:hypothetical protein
MGHVEISGKGQGCGLETMTMENHDLGLGPLAYGLRPFGLGLATSLHGHENSCKLEFLLINM